MKEHLKEEAYNKTKPLFLVKASVFAVSSYILIYCECSALIIT
jgi:hypothetical protein